MVRVVKHYKTDLRRPKDVRTQNNSFWTRAKYLKKKSKYGNKNDKFLTAAIYANYVLNIISNSMTIHTIFVFFFHKLVFQLLILNVKNIF